MNDAAAKKGDNRNSAGSSAGLKISPRSEQIAYWAAAGTVFVIICAVLVLETILPFAADQSEESAPAVLEAEQLMQSRQLRQARIKLDGHISENPDDAKAHAVRGLLRSATGLYAAALDDYNRAVRLDPENIAYRQSRGDINASIGWLDKAGNDYSEILLRDPSNHRALISRAQISVQQGDANQAVADIDIAIEVDPDNEEAHLMRAQIMQNIGNMGEALASYMKIKDAQGEIGEIVRHNIEVLKRQAHQQPAPGQ